MPITESRSPSHRTPANARIGDVRARPSRDDGGHIAPHVGKAASSPVSLKRADIEPAVGEPRGVIDSRRR
jgi:hypothetical protein